MKINTPNIDWDNLHKGEKVVCPECNGGYLVSPCNLKISKSFKCNKCGFRINMD